MTPIQKANRLVNRYTIVSNRLTYIDYQSAKICAIIAVDELIEDNGGLNKKYWEEVKTEIEKL